MISKSLQKLIRSLEQKKMRQREQLFVAEGPKVVGDLMALIRPRTVIATTEWLTQNADKTQGLRSDQLVEATEEELRKASFLQHPQQVLAIFPMLPVADSAMGEDELCLALDGVQDPGNLGTIIRIADWWGITRIYCSRDTADLYNPKVVQATMGSIARVHIVYVDLPQFIRQLPEGYPVYGTLLDGKNIYAEPLTPHGLIVMGNEGKGISPEVRPLVNRRLLIPSFPPDRPTAESLNVAIATAVTVAEFRRQKG